MEGTVNTIKKRYSVKLNNIEKIEQLLQENYDHTTQLENQIQESITQMNKTTILKDLDIDGKDKFGKIMNNYYTLLQKCTAQKQDIARLMAEVVKHGGNVKEAVDSVQSSSGTLDLDKLRKLAMDASTTSSAKKEVYEIK